MSHYSSVGQRIITFIFFCQICKLMYSLHLNASYHAAHALHIVFSSGKRGRRHINWTKSTYSTFWDRFLLMRKPLQAISLLKNIIENRNLLEDFPTSWLGGITFYCVRWCVADIMDKNPFRESDRRQVAALGVKAHRPLQVLQHFSPISWSRPVLVSSYGQSSEK